MSKPLMKTAIYLCLAATLCAQSVPETYEDVAYDQYERTVLDFWQAEGEGPRPLVVHIHGGGWVNGNKGLSSPEYFLNSGISVATINYRLTGTDPLPAPVHDAARAIQFLRYKAAEWNIDKNNVVVFGESAGGCSSVWIACHDDLANPNSADPVERESSRVQGAAGVQAQVTIDPIILEEWLGPYGRHGMIFAAVGETDWDTMLANYSTHKPTFEEFSPINHLSVDDPPMYLTYNADLTLPATSYGAAIHHGVFGIKFQEQAELIGHDQVHLAIAAPYVTTEYSSANDFLTKILLAPPNLIVGGSFESPVLSGSQQELRALDGYLPGWDIAGDSTSLGGVTLINGWFGIAATDGSQVLSLQSNSFGGGQAGVITRTFVTEVGVHYMLSFDYSALVQSGTATNTSITYDLGGADQTAEFTTAGVVSPWATETYVFTATSISTTLSIEGDYLGQWNGPLIDSVSVARTVLVPDNLIENGSFEATALGDVQQELITSADASLPGWDIADIAEAPSAGGVTLFKGWFGVIGSEGAQALSLQSNSFGGGVGGTISQTFATVVGGQYELAFDYCTLDDAAPGQATSITYDLGGADQTLAFNTGPTTVSPWSRETYVFTATATSTTLSIEGDNLGQWRGPLIDNVSVIRTDNLLMNGSFELTDIADVSFSEQATGSGAVTGWAVDAGGVILDDNRFGTASDGDQHLDLQSPSFGGGNAGIISQSFATEVGHFYSLSFDYSAISSTASMTVTYDVGGADQTVTFSNPSGQTWATETFIFKASSTSTTLTIEGYFLGSIAGPAIDNVSVTETVRNFNAWAAGETFANTFVDTLPGSNPDSDGLDNLLEFAFGSDPTVSDGGSISYGSGVMPGLPLPVLESITANGVDFRAVFARRKDWASVGLTYTVQFSHDLTEWVDSTETPTVLEDGSGDIDAVSVESPLAGDEPAQFFRLIVSQAP